jgi:hypothetical protein
MSTNLSTQKNIYENTHIRHSLPSFNKIGISGLKQTNPKTNRRAFHDYKNIITKPENLNARGPSMEKLNKKKI